MNSIRKKTSIGLLVILFIAFISRGLPDGLHGVTPVWWLFVCFAALGGLGAGAIDAGINTYVAQHHSTGSYWGMFTVGRIMARWYTKKITGKKLIYISIAAAGFGAAVVPSLAGVLARLYGLEVIPLYLLCALILLLRSFICSRYVRGCYQRGGC